MANTPRVDKTLFTDEHYLGKPAAEEDKIVSRRLSILQKYPEFFSHRLDCIEIGCGTGTSIIRISKYFKRTIGIDIYDYAAAFEIQKQINNAFNCEFRKLDLEHESFEQKFDRLISFEVIEHFKDEKSVRAFNAILHKNGIAAITVPNKWWIFETHGAKLPVLPWNRVPFFSWLPKIIHERFANARIYTYRRIKKLFEAHGFTVIDHCYITAPMDVLREGPLKKALVKFIFRNDCTRIPFLSTSIFVLLRKTEDLDG